MADSHPMHAWDDETRAGVRAWCEANRGAGQPRLDAARAALVELESRPSTKDERRQVNGEYQAAENAVEEWAGKLRTLDNRTVDSFDQGGQ